MNSIRNKVQLLGHVGQDPEINVLEDGKKFARFSMATNETFTNAQGEKVERTYWHNVVFWNRRAEIVEEYVKKGSKLLIEGSLTSRSWEDDAGVKYYKTEIVGRELLLL